MIGGRGGGGGGGETGLFTRLQVALEIDEVTGRLHGEVIVCHEVVLQQKREDAWAIIANFHPRGIHFCIKLGYLARSGPQSPLLRGGEMPANGTGTLTGNTNVLQLGRHAFRIT